jgi:DNA polymerase III sliding clamp (beta) subunit (PCNA family)
METTTKTKTVFINTVDLAQIVDMIVPCADMSEYGLSSVLSYVNFKITDGKLLKVCATDGSRLVVGSFVASAIADDFNYNIPASAFAAVRKLKKSDIAGGIYLLVEPGENNAPATYSLQLHKFVTDYSKQIIGGECNMGDYPRYEELFPRDYKQSVDISAVKSASRFDSHSPLERMVEHSKAIERASYKPATKKDNAKHGVIELTIGRPDRYSDIGANCDIAMAHEYFRYEASVLLNDTETPLDRIYLAFCSKFLVDALDHGVTVTLNYNDELKPVIFTYVGIPVKHLLMPIKQAKRHKI